jgi:hypothetical protein
MRFQKKFTEEWNLSLNIARNKPLGKDEIKKMTSKNKKTVETLQLIIDNSTSLAIGAN